MGSVRDPGETAWKKSANPHPSLAAAAWRQPGTERSVGKPPRHWQVPLWAQPVGKPLVAGMSCCFLGSSKSSWSPRSSCKPLSCEDAPWDNPPLPGATSWAKDVPDTPSNVRGVTLLRPTFPCSVPVASPARGALRRLLLEDTSLRTALFYQPALFHYLFLILHMTL